MSEVMPQATVLITTKNRKDDLRKAIESAVKQTATPEVLVIDDGSTDGTADMVRSLFATVRLIREEHSQGLIVRRCQGAQLATGPIVFSMDDDAVFSTPHIVEQTLAAFDHPRIGAVAIPFINVNQNDVLMQAAPDKRRWVTDCYIGTAHAIRRDLFLQLGGYRELFVHQGEEGDYCLRLLNAGYVVRLGTADPIHHFESPIRNWKRMDYYGPRNLILHAFFNVPLPALLVHLPVSTFNALRWSLKPSRLWIRLRGLVCGYGVGLRLFLRRQTVSFATYRLNRKLKGHPLQLDDLIGYLPAEIPRVSADQANCD